MKHLVRISFSCLFMANCLLLSAQPLINSINPSTSQVEQYSKFEVALDISALYDNPYDYDQIEVWAMFTGPDNQPVRIDGFFKEDFVLNANGSLMPDGEGFKIRFSPLQVGSYSYQIFAKDSTGTASPAPFSFDCVAISAANNHGFLRTSNTNFLQFDDGEPFILVGENICWQNNNPYLDYKSWLDKLSQEGGNYFRLWHAHWGLGIEWKLDGNGFEGLRRYHQSNGHYQDWLFDYCMEKGIYVMLALQHHGPVSSLVNPNWNDSPYNAAHGGPCQNTWDFFTDSTARAHTRNRFRYIVARWGNARSVLAWELFNEVDWTDDYDNRQMAVMEWHTEMAAYLKSIDPYGHLLTTSFAKAEHDPVIWANPDLDFTQTHYYVGTPHIERPIADGTRRYLADFGKPVLNGEFGIGLSSTLASVDPDGIHFHNGLWGALFSGSMGTGMSWWWDIYIDPQNLYPHFAGISALSKQIPFVDADLTPAVADIIGAEGPLSLIPSQDWGIIGVDTVVILPDGHTTPSHAGGALSKFLYGSQWNTQYRSPPVFVVDFPFSGTFTVRTGSNQATSPRVSIWVNGIQQLNQVGHVNSDFSVTVQAGPAILRVDNPGTDWVSIASYSFSNLGSHLDPYVLRSADKQLATGWLLHNVYNHEEVENNGVPNPLTGASLSLADFTNGNYFVKWYDCLTGNLVAVDPVTVDSQQLVMTVPPILWDLAFVVDDQAVSVALEEELAAAAFQVYPNPALAGEEVQIRLNEFPPGEVQISLLDMEGKTVKQHVWQAATQLPFSLPPQLAKGVYWVRVRTEDFLRAQAVLVE